MLSESEAADRKLHRHLSLQDLFFLSMGGIIGSGWLFAVLGADSVAGPAVVISWIVGGILVMFIALTYAEVAGMLPRSGAIVRYPHLTHGGLTGFLLGWAYFLTAVTVPTIEAEAVVSYASQYIPGLTHLDASTGKQILVGWGIAFAAGLMIVFFCLNVFGVRLLGRLNTVITWWKFILPTLTFILLFFTFHASNFTAGSGGFFAQGVPSIFEAIATSGIVFSFLGFRQALDYGGEARNPQRDVPRATIMSVIAAVVLYTLLQVAFTGAINWSAAGIAIGDWSKLSGSHWASAPFATELRSTNLALLVSFAVLLNIDAWVSPGGTGLVYTGTSTRAVFGLAMDGYFPPLFRRVSRFGVPVAGLVASLIIGWLFLLPLPSWYLLVGFISSATVLTYIMGGVSISVFRRTASQLHRPFRLRGASVLAPIAFISAGLIVYWSGTSTLNYVVGAVFIGLPLYAWFYAPAYLGVRRPIALAIGLVFLAAIVITGYFGPFYAASGDFTHAGGLSFWAYVVVLIVEVLAFAGVMWAVAQPQRRREVPAALWFIAYLFAVYIVSYLGAFGPRPASQQLPFPVGTIIVALVSLGAYYWAVASGYKTEEIEAIIEREGVPGIPSGISAAPSPSPSDVSREGDLTRGERPAFDPRTNPGMPPGPEAHA